ncbi:hypothetical protein [Rhizobium wuzhouense]|uniref:Uncharacterized protein n=1 Tax=Rhizobium wuzhouense TaxID=1986026 RepID=A0ABX5NNY1_9HYPH|nr:hypothetical protein [Rhizobium wuzhouense]PYB71297.1 hypothetical protein DMY87_18240 [Rhizobium wuzhouense]
MTPAQLHVLQHALGLDEHGQGSMYRNRFVTGEGSKDHPDCMALVALGFMQQRARVEMFGGDDMFWVTEAGKVAVKAESPPPPKLSASKQRYRDFLQRDGSETFGEFLKLSERRRKLVREGWQL